MELRKVKVWLSAAMVAGMSMAAMPTGQDGEVAVREVIAALEKAWLEGKPDDYASHFTNDAYFTNWNAHHVAGRQAIKQLMNTVLVDVLPGSKVKYEVRRLRFIRPEVAVVVTQGSTVQNFDEFAPQPTNRQSFILVKNGGKWEVDVFHNSAVQAE